MSGKGGAPSTKTAPDRRPHPDTNGLGAECVSEIQRTRMLSAMAEVCADYGVSNVTVAHVVARSGVSRRTFYEIFDDREACFIATMEEALASAARYVLPAYEASERWHERVGMALVALLEFLEDKPFMGRLLVVETLGAGPRALKRRQRVVAQLVTAVDGGRAEAKPGVGPPPLTAEGLVGGVLSVLHSRLLEHDGSPLLELTGPLMSMIALPYLGQAVARRELGREVALRESGPRTRSADPLRDVGMRVTYRTVRALTAVAERPGCSNREIGVAAGMGDQGQISKLLSRLRRLGLIQNTCVGPGMGAPNAWTLTSKGLEIERAIAGQATVRQAN